MPSDTYTFLMEPPGHWHVYWRKRVRFSVRDRMTEELMPDKNLEVTVTRASDPKVTATFSVLRGQVTDEGEGLYSMEFMPLALTPHAFSVAFREEDGSVHSSQPWSVEIARDGEEGIRAESPDGDKAYVYQVRYDWSAGPIHADDTEPVTLTFELMRGHQEGDDINWEQPWLNSFDHVTDAQNVVAEITTAEGETVIDTVAAEYRGMGVYQAKRVFPASEVGREGKTYGVTFRFTDPYNGASVANEEAYGLEVVGS